MITSEQILSRPRITEKSTLTAELSNAYVFEVSETATKKSVAKAIKDLYKVVPLKVNIVNLPGKKVISRGKVGRKTGVKKAYVYLKKGEKIDLI